jgi:hypothetical protein
VFTAQYGLILYIKQITFRLLKAKTRSCYVLALSPAVTKWLRGRPHPDCLSSSYSKKQLILLIFVFPPQSYSKLWKGCKKYNLLLTEGQKAFTTKIKIHNKYTSSAMDGNKNFLKPKRNKYSILYVTRRKDFPIYIRSKPAPVLYSLLPVKYLL